MVNVHRDEARRHQRHQLPEDEGRHGSNPMSVPTAAIIAATRTAHILKTDFERQAGSGGTKPPSFDDDWLGSAATCQRAGERSGHTCGRTSPQSRARFRKYNSLPLSLVSHEMRATVIMMNSTRTSAGLLLAKPAAAAQRPNILFLFADDQRADTIAAHGNPAIKTPNLDCPPPPASPFGITTSSAATTAPFAQPRDADERQDLVPH